MHSPTLIEIVRANTDTVESAVAHMLIALKPSGVTWNYLDGTKRITGAYKGMHNIDAITKTTETALKRPGHSYNIEIAKLIAPLAFGRDTKVFNLSARKFYYTDKRSAAYRIPFFFTEGGVVKAFSVQLRKNGRLSKDQVSGYASIVKYFLLDTEFFDMETDIEFVDCGVQVLGGARVVTKYSIDDLKLWDKERIDDHMNIIAEALRFIEDNKMIKTYRRPFKDPELPLFD